MPDADLTPAGESAATWRYDAPWMFTVTWDPEAGPLPMPILSLFAKRRARSTITPGRCEHITDKGHAAFYVGAVEGYVHKHHPDRSDITATAALHPETDQPDAEEAPHDRNASR